MKANRRDVLGLEYCRVLVAPIKTAIPHLIGATISMRKAPPDLQHAAMYLNVKHEDTDQTRQHLGAATATMSMPPNHL